MAVNLRNAGHDTRIDTRELSLGDDAIDFMNQGIAEAHTVIILFSKHTQNAKWQRMEMRSALWNEVEQNGGICIVVRLYETEIPPILGPKVYGWLDPTNPDSCQKVARRSLQGDITSKNSIFSHLRSIRSESVNPFRRLRAEFLRIAQTYTPRLLLPLTH